MKLKMLTFVGCIFLFFFHCALTQPMEFDNLLASGNKLKDHHLSRHLFQKSSRNKVRYTTIPDGYTIFDRCDDTVTAYKFSETKKSWKDAKLACIQEGANLGYPDCSEEGKTYYHILMDRNDGGAWMGMTDMRKEGNWLTVYNQKVNNLDYVNWAPTEPNNYGSYGENCAEMYDTDGKWYDSECGKKLIYICKMEVGF